MITARFFSEREFQRAAPGGSLQNMNQEFISKLDRTRERAGIPFVVNSAFRSVEHERRQGRAGTSSHTTGRAIDIRCNTDRNRFLILRAAFAEGWNRIGVHPTFIHLDDSPNHTPEVVWFY
jgi:uncharacterized protein YcbK (DUF882 family)